MHEQIIGTYGLPYTRCLEACFAGEECKCFESREIGESTAQTAAVRCSQLVEASRDPSEQVTSAIPVPSSKRKHADRGSFGIAAWFRQGASVAVRYKRLHPKDITEDEKDSERKAFEPQVGWLQSFIRCQHRTTRLWFIRFSQTGTRLGERTDKSCRCQIMR